MAQPYVGEIRMFGGNYAPAGWMFCDGQLLPISEYEVLFALIGTTYGGDGQSTFALPDLRGRAPVHQGNGFILAETGGAETVTLGVNQMPSHTHVPLALTDPGNATDPAGRVWAQPPSGLAYTTSVVSLQSMASTAAAAVGGNQPHENMMPFLCINFIISLFGIFPSQT